MTYKDFDLLVERQPDGFRARVLAAPAGTAEVAFRLPFADVEVENLLLRVGRARRIVRRAESSELQAAKTFGAALFHAVFSGAVEDCFRRSCDETKRSDMGLRLRLHLADPSLADLPWEYLYNPAMNRFLALSIQTPLVRYIELADPVQPIAVVSPIRALVMISSPSDYPELDVEGEWRRLNESLGDLVGSGQLAIDRLDEATLPALQRQLRRSRYHIFHFIGHGEFDQSAQEGMLILKNESDRGHRVGSQYLGMLLHDHASLRVAILNACEGARTSISDPYAGTAQTLVQQGIPAVIAMQFEIADEVASTFAHEFYGALSDGYPIDAALTEARKAIFAAGHETAWGTPVLYLRAPDGRIFDVDRRAPSEEPVEVEAASSAAILLRDAGVALAHGKYEVAIEHLDRASALEPGIAGLRDLMDTAQQQRAVAETRARLRRQVSEHVGAARDLAEKGELTAASTRLGEAFKLRNDDPNARALEAEIHKQMTETPRRHVHADTSVANRQVVAKADARPSNGRRRPQSETARSDGPDTVDHEEDLLD